MRGGFTLVELLVVIVIIAALAGLAAPQVIRQRKAADKVEAVSNARQIGLAMIEFENEYGNYPDTDSFQKVTDATGSSLAQAGNTSNAYFRQLLAAGFCQSEKIFYAKVPGSSKPDDDISTATAALKQGECGFGYMIGTGNKGFSAAGNPARPLAVTPLEKGQTGGTFDPDPFDRKAIVLRMDNSVSQVNIKQDKTINISGSKGLVATGDDTVWGSGVTGVTIVAPDLK
jgi:prepilin-type N-terminal cleavage/methylation domain-containing protein